MGKVLVPNAFPIFLLLRAPAGIEWSLTAAECIACVSLWPAAIKAISWVSGAFRASSLSFPAPRKSPHHKRLQRFLQPASLITLQKQSALLTRTGTIAL